MRPVVVLGAVALSAAAVWVTASSGLAGWFAAKDGALTIEGAAANATPVATEVSRCLDEAQIRRVLREELAASTAAIVAASGAPAPGRADLPPAPAASPAEVALVNSQLDRYIQAGVISNSEMARLQSEIGKLDPAARRAAMQKLVRAMNSGALDGRL
jgi:hypothetical protein